MNNKITFIGGGLAVGGSELLLAILIIWMVFFSFLSLDSHKLKIKTIV